MVKERVIRAVHESDLRDFLERAGVLEDALLGRLKCARCGQSIRIGEIGGFIARDGKLQAFCDKPRCGGVEGE